MLDGRLDVAQAGSLEQFGQVALPGTGQVRLVVGVGSISRTASQKRLSGPSLPAWSQTQAATTPSGRVTRAISRKPATGSDMKWTTSCASAASKDPSSNGRCSAGAWTTSTPG